MLRNAAVILLCVGLAFAVPVSAARAGDGDALVGDWHCDADGVKEVWHVKMQDDKWAVSGDYYKKGRHVGHFDGKDSQFVDGKLMFVQHWTKKPVPTWGDDAKITATATADKLSFAWDLGGSSGSRDMAPGK